MNTLRVLKGHVNLSLQEPFKVAAIYNIKAIKNEKEFKNNVKGFLKAQINMPF